MEKNQESAESAGPPHGSPTDNADVGGLGASTTAVDRSSDTSAVAWRTFVVPFVVFALFQSLEPARDSTGWFGQRYEHYPIFYTLKIVATLVALGFAWPGLRALSWRVSFWGVLVGVLGVVAWIGLCEAQTVVEKRLFPKTVAAIDSGGDKAAATGGDSGVNEPAVDTSAADATTKSAPASTSRPAYNPFVELKDQPWQAYLFLIIRFIGLAAVVPLIEELFWRGFVMRFFVQPDWWKVPLATWNVPGVALAIGLAVAMHPAELTAALIWFSAVTFMFLRTRNIGDCVLAHAITNLLLGVYVVATGEWHYL